MNKFCLRKTLDKSFLQSFMKSFVSKSNNFKLLNFLTATNFNFLIWLEFRFSITTHCDISALLSDVVNSQR